MSRARQDRAHLPHQHVHDLLPEVVHRQVRIAGAVRTATLAAVCAAALWDLVGLLVARPAWWPTVSYVLAAAAVLAGCAAVLFTLFTTRRVPPAAPAAAAAPARNGGQLLAVGLLLGVWLLRGHAEIPPDPPLIAGEVVAAALYAVFTRRRKG